MRITRWLPSAGAALVTLAVSADVWGAAWPLTAAFGFGAMIALMVAINIALIRQVPVGVGLYGLFLLMAVSWFCAGPALLSHQQILSDARFARVFVGMLVTGIALSYRIVLWGLPFDAPVVLRHLLAGPPPLPLIRRRYRSQMRADELARRFRAALDQPSLFASFARGLYGVGDVRHFILRSRVNGPNVAQVEITERAADALLVAEVGMTVESAVMFWALLLVCAIFQVAVVIGAVVRHSRSFAVVLSPVMIGGAVLLFWRQDRLWLAGVLDQRIRENLSAVEEASSGGESH